MTENILLEMEKFFGTDEKRINHAKQVLFYVREISKTEAGDKEIIEAAAVLHDIGILEAEIKYGSSAGKYQEIEGPPIADRILRLIGFPGDKLSEVLDIIGNHHSPGKIKTINFGILYDADFLVNLRDEIDTRDKAKTGKIINGSFLTETGKNIARRLYL